MKRKVLMTILVATALLTASCGRKRNIEPIDPFANLPANPSVEKETNTSVIPSNVSLVTELEEDDEESIFYEADYYGKEEVLKERQEKKKNGSSNNNASNNNSATSTTTSTSVSTEQKVENNTPASTEPVNNTPNEQPANNDSYLNDDAHKVVDVPASTYEDVGWGGIDWLYEATHSSDIPTMATPTDGWTQEEVDSFQGTYGIELH